MKPRTCFLLLLGVALVLRTAYLVEGYRHNPTFECPIIDAYTYDTLAVREASGAGMGPESVWQSLFYPYFLSVCYRLFGHRHLPVRIIQLLLGLGTCALTFRLGARLFSIPVGLIGMAAVVLCGPLIFFEGELLPTTWEVFWFLGSLVLFQEWMETCGRRSLMRFFICGLVCAAGIMIRPTVLPFYAVAVALLVADCDRGVRGRTGALVAAAAGAALVFVPVMARNHALTKRWILLPLSGGLNFYIGNNPDADKTIAIRPGDQWYRLTVSPRKVGVVHAQEGPRYFYGKSFEFIRRRPLAFARGLADKAALLLSSREIPRNTDIYLFRRYSRTAAALTWRRGGFGFPAGIVIPFALLGMVVGLRRLRDLALLYLYVATYATGIVLFFVSARYRAPLLPALCILGASGIAWLRATWAGGRRAAFAGGLVALTAFGVACNRPVRIPEDRVDFDSELSMALGSVHMARGEEEEGERRLREALARNPRNVDAHALLGTVHLRKGNLRAAETESVRALEIDPCHIGALLNLARVQRAKGEWGEAAGCYARALALDPGNSEIHEELAGVHERLGDSRAASLEYWKALKLKPESIPIRRRLAFLLGSEGEWQTARELIAEAVRHQPEDAALRCDLGVIYGNSGRTAEAVAQFEEALRLKPDDPVTLLNLGILHQRAGDRSRARSRYERLAAVDPAMAAMLKTALESVADAPGHE